MRRYNVYLLLTLLSLFGLAASCARHEPRFRIGVSQCSDDEWRHQMSLERTKERRPDLYEAYVAAHAEEFAPKKPKRRRKAVEVQPK